MVSPSFAVADGKPPNVLACHVLNILGCFAQAGVAFADGVAQRATMRRALRALAASRQNTEEALQRADSFRYAQIPQLSCVKRLASSRKSDTTCIIRLHTNAGIPFGQQASEGSTGTSASPRPVLLWINLQSARLRGRATEHTAVRVAYRICIQRRVGKSARQRETQGPLLQHTAEACRGVDAFLSPRGEHCTPQLLFLQKCSSAGCGACLVKKDAPIPRQTPAMCCSSQRCIALFCWSACQLAFGRTYATRRLCP